jgi:F-type H+-transporting ATPase subunit a
MEHHSILYGPVNRLLIALLGPPPLEKVSTLWLREFLFPDGAHAWLTDTTIMTLLLTLIIAILFPLAARKFDRERPGGVQNFLEMIVDGIRSLLADVIGHGAERRYLSMIGTFAIFIFLGNFFGLFFPLTPPTASLSTTVALAFIAFLYFNWQGIKEQGFARYMWHFTGPSVLSAKPSWLERIAWFPLVLLLFMIFLAVESVSNVARILSLSLRLFMNISGEHTVTGFFSSLVPIFVPWPLMILGLFTAFLQSFIFVTLTAVYVNLSTAHEEH